MKSKTPDRLRRYISTYAETYPGVWKLFAEFRAERGGEFPMWPDWCWCPLAASYAIVSGGSSNPISGFKMYDVSILGALAAWRMTQGIYRFDPDLFSELWKTPLEGNLPIDILYRLPEWCVYIEMPPKSDYRWFEEPLLGFFVHLEWDADTGRPEMRFLFDAEEYLTPFVIHLTESSLVGCVREAIWEINKYAKMKYHFEAKDEQDYPEIRKAIAPFVSIVLYLCSVSADVSDLRNQKDRPQKPKPQKTKKGARIFAPTNQTIWLVGYRVGASLRLARNNKSIKESGGHGEHVSPRPHIRKAHWHSFWTGPRKDLSKRKLVLKWLPPVLVGTGEIVPTIREVEKD